MKKIIIITMLIICCASPAFAVLPVLAYAASTLLHTATVAGFLWYASNLKSSTGSVTPNGNLSHTATVQWVDLTGTTPTTITKDLTVKMNNSDIKTAVANNPTKYPNLKTNLQVASSFNAEDYNGKKTPTVGDIIVTPTGTKKITSATFQNNYNVYQTGETVPNMISSNLLFGTFVPAPAGTYGKGYWPMYLVNLLSVTPPEPRDATVSEFAQNLSGSTNGGSLTNSLSQTELDTLLQETAAADVAGGKTWSSSTIKYVDTTTEANADSASSYSQPSSPSSSTVSNAAQAAANQATAATVTSASNNVSAAQAAYNAAVATYGANSPQASSAAQTLSAAQLAEAQAAAAAAQAAANTVQQAATEDQSTTISTTTLTPYKNGDDSAYSFGTRFTTFINTIKSSGLFSLPNMLTQNFPSTSSSVMTFNGGSTFGTHTFDFANFATAFAVLKTILLICFSAIGIKIITLKGGAGS